MRSRIVALGFGLAVGGLAVASAVSGWLVAVAPDPTPLWAALPLAVLVPALGFALAPALASLVVATAAPGVLVAAAMLLGLAAHGHAGALTTLAMAAVLSIVLLGPLVRRAHVELARSRTRLGRLALVGAQAGLALCFRCRGTRPAVRRTGALWHAAATVLTAGLWGPVWIMASRRSTFRCLDCGGEVGMPEVAMEPVRLLRPSRADPEFPTALRSRG